VPSGHSPGDTRGDPVTGLPTRERLERALRAALTPTAARDLVGLLYLDLDGFKPINDVAGHQAGDALLRSLAGRLSESVPRGDLVARVGGDEFAVLVLSAATPGQVLALADRLAAALGEPVQLRAGLLDGDVSCSASIGVAVLAPGEPPPGTPEDLADLLLRQADLAMYAAKRRGPGQVARYSPDLAEQARAEVALGVRLHRALRAEAFRLLYQPVLAVSDGRPVRVEALLRFVAADGTLLAPRPLLDLAEKGGRLDLIARWVVEQAAVAARGWQVGGLVVPVSINLAAGQLAGPGSGRLLGRLRSTDVPLVVELHRGRTEVDRDRLREARAELRAGGVAVVLDDAAGQWSVGDLLDLAPDEVTIDRDLVARLEREPTAGEVLGAVVQAARAIGARVTAKGVAGPAALAAAVRLGSDAVQGEGVAPATADPAAWWTSHLTMRDTAGPGLTLREPLGSLRACQPGFS
jgi:diguanylate cyclase (GGDEF)-like protein